MRKDTTMHGSERVAGEERGRDDQRPTIVRQDEVTQGTEVANLPHADDPIQEASEESFPASDPPAFSGRRDDRLAEAEGESG